MTDTTAGEQYGYQCTDCGFTRWQGAPQHFEECDECGSSNLGTLHRSRPARYIDLTEGEGHE